jgi:hypothetical protein
MKLKLISVFVAATALITTNSNAVTLALAGVANTSIGLITLDPDTTIGNPSGLPNTAPRAVASGRAIFVSVTNSLTGVYASMETLLSATNTAASAFDTALTALITGTNTLEASTNPGIVRSTTFASGALTSTGSVQLGTSGNKTYLFLVAESAGFITVIGVYNGANVPTSGSVTFNPTFANDTAAVGTSVLAAATVGPVQPISGFQLAAAVPEPSAALLGALGALGLIRRRRI